MTIQNTDNEALKEYRVKTLRVFGGIQIGNGVLCGILSLAGLITDSVNLSKNCDYNYNSDYNYDGYYYPCDHYDYASQLLAFDIICVNFSGWFILTGTFPFCMNARRQSSWKCLKIAFIVCCIVGALTFIPTVFSLGVVGAIFRAELRTDTVVLSSFIAVLGVYEWVIAIAAASYYCCCTSWDDTDRGMWYVTSGQHINTVEMPNTQMVQTGAEQNVSGINPAVGMKQETQVSTYQLAEGRPGQGINMQQLPPQSY